MGITDEEAFTSKPFTFIVEGTAFNVHAGLISECSKPLDRMINGHLSEAKQGFALLEDVDKASFVRFIRWLYSREYPAMEHKITNFEQKPTPAYVAPKTDEPDDEWGFTSTKKSKKKKGKEIEKGSLKEAFISRKYDWDSGWDFDAMPITQPRSNKEADEDYTEVFLSHARIYVFAEKYDIQSLKNLAWKKLQQTLSIYTLYPERVGDIITLLKYVWANTLESAPGVEDIRTMLAHYIGCEMEILVRDGEIKELLASNKEMLGDFLDMFASRVT